MATQEEKEYAIKTLGDIKTPLVDMFMGIDINEFSKDELIWRINEKTIFSRNC